MTGDRLPVTPGVSASGVDAFGADDVRRATAAWLMRYGSPRTRDAYGTAHRAFVSFLRSAGVVDVRRVERAHVDAFARLLEESGAKPSTVAARLAAVGSWLGALVDHGVLERNPAVGVRRPKVDRRVGTTRSATDDQIRRLLAAGANVGADAAILVGLLVELGIRVGSVCTIGVDDVLDLPDGGTAVRFRRKGGAETIRAVSDDLGVRLQALAAERAGSGGTLLRGLHGGAFTRDVAKRLWQAIARDAGCPGVHPHMVRVWAVSTALGVEGVQLHDVQDFMDHADPSTTRRYDRARNRKDRVVAAALVERATGHRPPSGPVPAAVSPRRVTVRRG